jgi:hypothetical protein
MKIPYHTKDIEALVSTQRSTLQSTVRVSSSSSLNSRFALPTHSNTTSPRSCVKIFHPSVASLRILLAITTARGSSSLRFHCTSTCSGPGSSSTSSYISSTIRESVSEPEPTRIRIVFTPSFWMVLWNVKGGQISILMLCGVPGCGCFLHSGFEFFIEKARVGR